LLTPQIVARCALFSQVADQIRRASASVAACPVNSTAQRIWRNGLALAAATFIVWDIATDHLRCFRPMRWCDVAPTH
jgi:hypothetical protein